jgi:putative hydrolase
MGLLGQAGGALFGSQLGQAVGGLAGEVLSACDIGLPLGPVGRAALLPANIAVFAEGLDVPLDDVRLYLALREAAHQRLFSQVPWLAAHLRAAVEDYGRGTTIDVSRIEQQLTGFDPSNPAALQEALESGLFEPEKTPTQQAALVRLETVLALVEGWVDEVVGQATAARMPSAGKLQELVRRRRAAGGPAETAFAALVGLELRPRRLRDASALWGSLRSRKGADGRDAVWAHPDLMPTAADLDDPLGFGERGEGNEAAALEADFDAALAELLDGDGGSEDGGSEDGGSEENPGKDGGGSPA